MKVLKEQWEEKKTGRNTTEIKFTEFGLSDSGMMF